MTTRSVSPLESDPQLLSVLTIYGVHSPVGTIRAALQAGHSEQSLRARVAWLWSQLVEVPFSERGACTVENAPSWKAPYAPQKVHACLSKPENVAGAANLGWGSVDAVWQSYADEASEMIEPSLGLLSPKRWNYADGEKGRKNYAPMGSATTDKPKTRKLTTEARRHGENSRVVTGPRSPETTQETGDQVKPLGVETHIDKAAELGLKTPGLGVVLMPVEVSLGSSSVPLCLRGESETLATALSTPEGRERLAGLVAQLPGGARLRSQILAGELTTAGKMACRSALMMEAGK